MTGQKLLDNSIVAFFSAIEIHNKPKISYRYETTVILLLNAWELVLKAYISLFIPERSIFEDEKHTISFSKAVSYVAENINSKKPRSFNAIEGNLIILEKYRNEVVHYYYERLEPIIFSLVAQAVINFINFIEVYFSRNIISEEGLFITPLGFNLPLQINELLSKKSISSSDSVIENDFIDLIVNTTKRLVDEGIQEPIMLTLDVFFKKEKALNNSDLIAIITSSEDADIEIGITKTYQLTSDKSAQMVHITEDQFFSIYPYSHHELVSWCRENINNFKQGKLFNEVKKEVKNNKQYVGIRRINPKNENSTSQMFYSVNALQEIKRIYEEMDNS